MTFGNFIRLSLICLVVVSYSVTFPVLSLYHPHPVGESTETSSALTQSQVSSTVSTDAMFCTACRVTSTQIVVEICVHPHSVLPYVGLASIDQSLDYHAYYHSTHQGRAPPIVVG